MKVLITGASGFTAYHLVKGLREGTEPKELYFSSLSPKKPDYCGDYFSCDLSRLEQVRSLIKKIKPQQIYHLAGTYTNDYVKDYKSNVLSSMNILDSLLHSKIDPKVLLIGSAAEYGFVNPADNPIPEDYPLRPVSIYGLTKAHQTQLMSYYCRVHGLNIAMARTFNLAGKGMSSSLFVGHVYEQIEKYKRREISRIIVGNLNNRRDYIHVDEAVKYYRIIMACGAAGEIYNVGSGKPIRVYELLDQLLNEAGLGKDSVEIRDYPTRNKIDVAEIYADIRKIKFLEEKYLEIGQT
ncbi:MAG: NAD-dependent epimerase/dehydratase family protein [Nitrospira sp.]